MNTNPNPVYTNPNPMYTNPNSMYDYINLLCNDSNLNPMQRRLVDRIITAEIEVDKEAAKKNNRDEKTLQTLDRKQLMKEYFSELKKAQYEDLLVENGAIQVITRNLRNAAVPMRVANFQQPELDLLQRIADDLDIAYRIRFVVGGCSKAIYLNKERVGKGGYLLQKFSSEGAVFVANSSSKKKEYACMLFAYLLIQKPHALWVADEEGWAEFPGKGMQYVGEGDLTWKKILRLSR